MLMAIEFPFDVSLGRKTKNKLAAHPLSKNCPKLALADAVECSMPAREQTAFVFHFHMPLQFWSAQPGCIDFLPTQHRHQIAFRQGFYFLRDCWPSLGDRRWCMKPSFSVESHHAAVQQAYDSAFFLLWGSNRHSLPADYWKAMDHATAVLGASLYRQIRWHLYGQPPVNAKAIEQMRADGFLQLTDDWLRGVRFKHANAHLDKIAGNIVNKCLKTTTHAQLAVEQSLGPG